MAQYYPVQLPVVSLTSQYSNLHQERLYLLKALAEEESRGERLNRVLEEVQAQASQTNWDDGSENFQKTKQSMERIRNKLGQCQQTERALTANLANVVAQMEGVKRYQWRSAQQNHVQQTLQAQLMHTSPVRPEFALRSPATFDLTAQMSYLSMSPMTRQYQTVRASYCPHLASFNQPMPQTPVIMPYVRQTPASAYYGQRTVAADNSSGMPSMLQPLQTQAKGMQPETSSAVSAISPFSLGPSQQLQNQDGGGPVSTPVTSRPASTSSILYTFAEMPAKEDGAGRSKEDSLFSRLSMLDATSAGLKPQANSVSKRSSM